jgi:hypothetical protein
MQAQWTTTGTTARLTTTTNTVSIGATSATEKLEVIGNIKGSGNLIFGNTASTGMLHLNSTTNNFTLRLNATDRLFISNSTGNVGIGTTSPTYLLDLASSTNAKLRVTSSAAPNPAIIETTASGVTGAFESILSPSSNVRMGSRSNNNFALMSNNVDRITLLASNGYVGIGTSSPSEMLHVNGSARATGLVVDNASPMIYTGASSGELNRFLRVTNSSATPTPAGLRAGGVVVADDFTYSNPTKNDLVVKGKLVIGSASVAYPYALAVNGQIGAKDIQLTAAGWSDYVFEESYKLPSLTEVEAYIRANKHLEGIPTESEVMKDGYSVNELNVALLKKVEELTLYVIQQQKELDDLKKRLEQK